MFLLKENLDVDVRSATSNNFSTSSQLSFDFDIEGVRNVTINSY